MSARGLTATLALLLVGWSAAAQALVPVPRLTARVTDQTATLDAGQIQILEQRLQQFEAAKGAQVALLIVPTTEPEAIEQFSLRVVEAWKLGRTKVDDGALLIVAKNDRTLRIEVGYGLEGILPDAIAKRIIEETIVPLFKQGDFFGGLSAGLEQMMKVIEGEPLPPPKRSTTGDRLGSAFEYFPFLLFGAIAVGGILRAVLGRVLGATAGGVLAGVLVWFLVGVLVVSGFLGLMVFLMILLGNAGGGRGRSGGGFYSGGFSGGGGGGGFSGGGGSFGGGGASGRW